MCLRFQLAAQISASPDLEANQRRANKTDSSHSADDAQSAAAKNTAPPQSASPSKQPSTSTENPAPKSAPPATTNYPKPKPQTTTAAATYPKPQPTTAAAKPQKKRSLRLLTDSDSDSDSAAAAAVSAPPAHRRRRRRLMTPPDSQSLLSGPLPEPVTPAAGQQRRRPVAVVHPALRPQAGRRGRPAPRGAGTGAGAAGGGAGAGMSGVSAGDSGSVRRLPAPRRSSLEFEAARQRRRPAAPRGRLVLTNLRSVERETLLPVITRLGGAAVMDEVGGYDHT